VLNLLPLPEKDLIELAFVKGWKCIVRKGEFNIGDLAVFFALGAVPDKTDPRFASVKSTGRVTTVRMGGVNRQGLLVPLSYLAERGVRDISSFKEGDDVTTFLGVKKYIPNEEAEQYRQGQPNKSKKNKQQQPPIKRADFPSYVPRTDAMRLQMDPELYLAAIKDSVVTVTRKEDGCSCTFVYNNGDFLPCGRNYVWDESDRKKFAPAYFQMMDKFDLKNKMTALGRNLAIQGEITGPNVNSNRMGLKELTFSVFDVFDVDNQCYFGYDEMCAFCAQLGLTTVPVLYRGPANALNLTLEGYLDLANKTEYGPGEPAEGVVVTSDTPSPLLGRVRFKTISDRYLLKYKM
jgi:RNA ligase (TIGR02306 family)